MTIRGEKIVTVLAVLGVLVGFAQAREKDHSADYQVGTFSSTGTISDVTGEICTRWNERESTWRKSGSCPSRGTSQSRS